LANAKSFLTKLTRTSQNFSKIAKVEQNSNFPANLVSQEKRGRNGIPLAAGIKHEPAQGGARTGHLVHLVTAW
jgi:hypothetical protein